MTIEENPLTPAEIIAQLRAEHLNNQFKAADPEKSVWVSANAGSGKTRALTDRIIRLMLEGTPPGKILCVTFTKAAAAEMSERLYKRLGEWIVKSDIELIKELKNLTRADPKPEKIGEARRLFARVLETPGGLKIQTVHGFCEGLLKRFPAEAGVSPAFELLEDNAQKLLQRKALDEIFTQALEYPESDITLALIEMLKITSKDGLIEIFNDRTVRKILKRRGLNAFYACAGADPEQSRLDEKFAENYFLTLDRRFLAELIDLIKDKGKATDSQKLCYLYEILQTPVTAEEEIFRKLQETFLTSKKEFPKKFFTKNITEQGGAALQKLIDDFCRYAVFRERARIDNLTRKFGLVACAFHTAYEEKKRADTLLDYDDLIEKTADLLDSSEKAAWVLYKSDGGIDHVLIDEAQDTSPEQWRIIENLTADFFTGKSSRNLPRTVFAVGDEKQSVYGFNGADPACMSESLERFQLRENIISAALEGSFRSAPAILKLTDMVFSSERCSRSVSFGETIRQTRHYAVENAGPGKITLYSPFYEPEKIERDWLTPPDQQPENSAQARMAKFVARKICALLKSEEILPSTGQAPQPKDILVLLRKRGSFAGFMRRALKNANLPVAGADRMILMQEQAVLDLVALIEFTLLPSDDLNLACLLRSPLCGFTEEDLFALCHGRESELWLHLQRKAVEGNALCERNVDFLRRCLRFSDFGSPYDFLIRVLERERGQEKFIRVLGRSCLDPIDELLNCALSFARAAAPSLQNFIAFLRGGTREIKRENPEQDRERGGEIRVMTVHGAKGLEAPIVFIPDVSKKDETRSDHYIEEDENGNAIWIRGHTLLKEEEPFRTAISFRKEKDRKEYYRLLYVALTRAKDQLFITGVRKAKKKDADPEKKAEISDEKFLSWYDTVKEAIQKIPGAKAESCERNPEDWTYLYHDAPHGDPKVAALIRQSPDELQSEAPILPDFIARSPEITEDDSPVGVARLSPSNPEQKQSEPYSASAALRGERIHKLLELLPKVKAEDRKGAGTEYLIRAGVSRSEAEVLAQEAVSVIEHPDCEILFGENSHAEIAIAGVTPGLDGRYLSARLDRLAITETAVYAADFKSGGEILYKNQLKDEYLLQAGLYYVALRALYPGKKINFFMVATSVPKLYPLDSDLLEERVEQFLGRDTGQTEPRKIIGSSL